MSGEKNLMGPQNKSNLSVIFFMLDLCGEKKKKAEKSDVFLKNYQKPGQKMYEKPAF